MSKATENDTKIKIVKSKKLKSHPFLTNLALSNTLEFFFPKMNKDMSY